MNWKVPLFKTYNDSDDIAAVSSVIRRGTYWAIGPEIQEFENKIAHFIGKKYALSFNSGTSALHALLEAYNIKGKEVIVPSFTFIATANAVLLAGGIPVFAEAEDATFGLDLEDVERKITQKTIAVMPIHYAGCVARDIEKIRDLCSRKGLLLIEDAAQSFGATMHDIKAGCFGDAAMFSFCKNKVITTGEGGVIVTDSEKIYEKLKLLRSHGRVEAVQDYFSHTGDNEYIEVGYNFRMSSISAALGLSQLKKFAVLREKRKHNASILDRELSKLNQNHIRTPFRSANFEQVYQMYTLLFKEKKIRDGLQKHLEQKGIMSKVYFMPVHLKELYLKKLGWKKGDLPKTELLSEKVLTIPLYADMGPADLQYIIDSITQFFQGVSD